MFTKFTLERSEGFTDDFVLRLRIDDSFAQRTDFEHSEKTSFGSPIVETGWEGWQPQVLKQKQTFAIQHLQGWSTEGELMEFETVRFAHRRLRLTAYPAEKTLAHSLAGLAQLYQGAKKTDVLSLYYSLINHVAGVARLPVRVPSLPLTRRVRERRIDEQNIERLLAGFSDKVLRDKVGYALQLALKEVLGQFSFREAEFPCEDLVAEVHAAENFGDGETTGQYNLLVIIKQEQYSVIEVILKLADAIFGPLFLETGVLFGLTVMSEQVGRTVCLLAKE